jgi:hypothetical protein
MDRADVDLLRDIAEFSDEYKSMCIKFQEVTSEAVRHVSQISSVIPKYIGDSLMPIMFSNLVKKNSLIVFRSVMPQVKVVLDQMSAHLNNSTGEIKTWFNNFKLKLAPYSVMAAI